MVKIYILLLLVLGESIFAQEIHSSVSTYYENKTFKDSTQKKDGVVYGVGADLHHNGSELKLAYEEGYTNTKQPPLPENLETKKIFLKYAYRFDKNFDLHINYISIEDNLAETDGGSVGGGGFTYYFNKKAAVNITQYFTDYAAFNVFQSDLRIDYKSKVEKVKMHFSLITKYINIEDENPKSNFTKYAESDYATTGIKLHSHYDSYHFGMGAYFGRRAFAVMNDGFKVQHYAMEFDRTYAIGAGKTLSDFVVRFQYIYQRAKELPAQNEKDVDVQNLRFIANYKF